MGYMVFLDRNDFKKKERALRRYFMKSYKQMIFHVMPTIIKDGKKDGAYMYELECDELFKRVYGPLMIQFTVKDDVAIIEDLLPSDILISCFMGDLPIYKGIPYRNEKDLKKIKIMEKLI